MEEHDERTSLVRSNSALNGYNAGNAPHHNYNHPPRTSEDPGRRDPRTFLTQVQRSLALFQGWAAKVLHESEDSSAVNWVQNARVARMFMMIVNVILVVSAFLLMGVEIVEMVLREPILDYLLPESEVTIFAAGFAIVAGAFGFAVAYNLLVEDTKGGDKRDNDDGRRGNGSGGNGGDLGPRTPTPPHSTNIMHGRNSDSPIAPQQQQARRPRIMFTKASAYLLNGNAIFLAVTLMFFIICVTQRSGHLSQMGIELNNAWTEANRHRTKLISDFELRHECCGYNHISDRPFPPIAPKGSEKPKDRTCSENDAYGFKVACKADLTKDFERWHKGIRNLLLGQVTILLPLMLLVMTLSAINFLKLRGWKQEELEDAKTQAEASTIVPVVNGRGDTQYERPLLEDASPRNGETPFLVNVETEPARFTHDRPVVQPSLI